MSPIAVRAAESLRAELTRTNYAGRQVSLLEGVLVVGATSALASRGGGCREGTVLLGIGALGLAHDLLEPRARRAGSPVSKGLRGHARALRSGKLTTGALKALAIPALALLAAPRVDGAGGAPLRLVDGALIAGAANLVNLLDLRPGRALKVVVPAAALLAVGTQDPSEASGRTLARAALLPSLAVLPADLREHGMLGDAGANVLGAAVGAAATRRLPVAGRLALLAGVLAATIASERVSFSAVIEATPVLRTLDQWGRRVPRRRGGTA